MSVDPVASFTNPTIYGLRKPAIWPMELINANPAGAEAVHGFAEFQGIKHLQFGKANVYPVEVIEQVADENEGDQAQAAVFVLAHSQPCFALCL